MAYVLSLSKRQSQSSLRLQKKIVCHEGVYANFDPTHTNIPQASILEIDPKPDDPEDASNIEGVHSIKVLRESKMNSSMNEPLPPPPTKKVSFDLSHQPENQGEKLYELESYLDEDSLLIRLNQNKSQTKKIQSTHQDIDVVLKKIANGKHQQGLPTEGYGSDSSAKNVLKERRNQKALKRKAELQVGDEVKIKTIRFDKNYAKGLPEYTYGKIMTMKGTKAGVRYEGEVAIHDTNKTHLKKVDGDRDQNEGDVVAMVLYQEEWYEKKTNLMTVMATLEVGSALNRSGENEESSWPKDFLSVGTKRLERMGGSCAKRE
jgi:hypothetical protein